MMPRAMWPALALMATTVPSRADVITQGWQAPTLTVERYNEDWSTLADPAQRGGHWSERFKYIPLGGEAGDNYLTTGAELRARNENFQGDWARPSAPDNGYVWLRWMPYGDLHIGAVRGFVQPVLAYAAGVRPAAGPVDQTRTDLLQAFADLTLTTGATSIRLRAGREMIGLGSERLIGTRYGPNVPLAFDGGRVIVQHGTLTLNLLLVRPVDPGPRTFDDATSSTRQLWGGYATWSHSGRGVDVYVLGYRNANARPVRGTAREVRYTVGARWFGKSGGLHWNIEAMDQFGRFGTDPIAAWSIATETGFRFAHTPLRPDLTVRFNVASGDRHGAGKALGTFDAMFPKGKYFGELSPIGPANLINVQPLLGLDLGGGVSMTITGAAYWRQSSGDGVYDIPGHVLRGAGGSVARHVGTQAEIALSWRASRELTLGASASWFGAGRFLRETGLATPIRMTGLEANWRF